MSLSLKKLCTIVLTLMLCISTLHSMDKDKSTMEKWVDNLNSKPTPTQQEVIIRLSKRYSGNKSPKKLQSFLEADIQETENKLDAAKEEQKAVDYFLDTIFPELKKLENDDPEHIAQLCTTMPNQTQASFQEKQTALFDQFSSKITEALNISYKNLVTQYPALYNDYRNQANALLEEINALN